MRILVTGATGFVGKRLVQALKKKGHTVIGFGSEANLLTEDGLSRIRSKRFEVVYHLAAELDESRQLWKLNVEGTRNLLDLCKRRDLERFILLGPIGVLGETRSPAREDDPYAPKTKYEKSKEEAERIVMDYRLKHQIPYTIVRSTIIYGPNRFWGQILKAAENNYPMIGRGENSFHLVYIDDVIDFLLLCLKPDARNQIYNLAGPDVLSYRDTYKLICKLMHKRFPSDQVNPIAAKAASLAYLARSKVTPGESNVTMLPSSIDRLLRNRVVDITKAQSIGYKPKYKLEKGLAKTIKELKA
ncbi:MAG: NAD(P)-dependent oxidoreductase [Candidatus Diapherotrites archaeon]|nr:NAD(P)-dependent oxidoreductase [Candidatus Diapherotrites archaeon]